MVHDTAVDITFVNSGFIDGCEVPTLDDYDEELNIVPYKFKAKVGLAEQRVIASNCFGSSSKNIIPLLYSEEEGMKTNFGLHR